MEKSSHKSIMPFRLHVKVTLLTAGITALVLTSIVAVVTNRITQLALREQCERAELAAISLATETGRQQIPHDPDRIRREAAIVRSLRTSFTAVRVYELSGNGLIETAFADGSSAPEPITFNEIVQLQHGETVKQNKTDGGQNFYRVLAPIITSSPFNRIIGAVEVVVTLTPALTTAEDLSQYILWLIVVAAIITLASTYLMMRSFVYNPIQNLLHAMQRAESGDLSQTIALRAPDELGVLTLGFNRMISRLHDMTDEREKQRELLALEVQKATQELWLLTRKVSEMERLAAAGQTAAQFAHEVGTPLHIINGHVQLLKGRIGNDEKTRNRLEILTEQVKRIENIVRTMLNRTRPPEAHRETVAINEIVQKVCEATAPSIEARGIHFETRFDATLPNVSADPEQLQQALLNLINNAIDATETGGNIAVSTTYQEKEQEVTIEISDTGIGMPPEVAARIFDPLYTTKERGRGTGLGLVIVQQISREHGGRVNFETHQGSGTTFRLHLPVERLLANKEMPLLTGEKLTQ